MSIKDLMHSMIGTSAGQSALQGQIAASMARTVSTNAGAGILAQHSRPYTSTNKKLFHGNIEVLQVANGYIINIGRKEGYEYVSYVASTPTEVNEIIAAQIVAFRLEDNE